MAIQTAEVAAIANNPAAPTFENTVVALEKSGRMLGRVSRVFYTLTGANTTDALDAIDEELSPRLSAHNDDAINLDPALFARVQTLYDARASMTMTPEDAKLLERTYEQMVHAGAKLTPDQRERVKAINTELSTVTTKFGQTVREATVDGAVIVADKAMLKGLSEGDIQAAAKLATEKGQTGKYALVLQNTTSQPALSSLTDRALREKLYNASIHRSDQPGENDTRMMVAKIAQLRAEKAALFGAPDWATYAMYDRMAETPKTALDFMDRMLPPLAAAQRREAGVLDAQIKKDGGKFTVKPWDWALYADEVKKAKFDLSDDEVKPYFEIHKVLEDGVFYAANQLYGISFKQRTDLPVYHPDVWTYDVTDQDGSQLGIFYFDPYQRPSKRGGAWMSNFVDQSFLFDEKPVIYNVLNVPKAGDGEPQLVSFGLGRDDVPRIRPRAARVFRQPEVSQPVGHRDRARLRRISQPSERAVGERSQDSGQLCQALQDRRGHSQGPDRQDRRRGQIQPGPRFRRDGGSRLARHEMARAHAHGSCRDLHPRGGNRVRDQGTG